MFYYYRLIYNHVKGSLCFFHCQTGSEVNHNTADKKDEFQSNYISDDFFKRFLMPLTIIVHYCIMPTMARMQYKENTFTKEVSPFFLFLETTSSLKAHTTVIELRTFLFKI